MSNIKIEVCAGNVQDCITAEKAGAHQVELNSAVHLGGLTPSLGTLILAKEKVSIPLFPMLRTRGGGFHYNDVEVETMRKDAHLFGEHKADGLVFGFLNKDNTVDAKLTKEFADICKSYNIDAIYHRAFDCTPDAIAAIETLIECGITRILTSGQTPSAYDGIELLAKLQKDYGDKIELVIGSGVNGDNAKEILERTGVHQIHASFKSWANDPTTNSSNVSYEYSDKGSYEEANLELIKTLITNISK